MERKEIRDKLKVVHITADDKFFDGPIRGFESDESLENIAYLADFGKKKLKFIKSKDKIRILEHKSDLKRILKEGEYDVVFFYSLPLERWWMVDTIPRDKVIIWWEWGYEVYGSKGGMEPLIKIPLYKPITEKYVKWRPRTIVQKLLMFIKYKRQYKALIEQRKRVLMRIDYIMPVLPIDYEFLKKHKEFRARKFYYKLGIDTSTFKIEIKSHGDGILLGNSSLVSNNHLDVWDALIKSGISNRRIIIPLNYGEFDTAVYVSNRIKSESNEVMILRNFLPQKEYFNLVDSCSYAIFGVMRQQAVGNIKKCIREGIKVFLYKDSMCYKSLTQLGYKVYPIEDMDMKALTTPMSKEDIKHNIEMFLNEVKYKDKIYNDVMVEIRNKRSKYNGI